VIVENAGFLRPNMLRLSELNGRRYLNTHIALHANPWKKNGGNKIRIEMMYQRERSVNRESTGFLLACLRAGPISGCRFRGYLRRNATRHLPTVRLWRQFLWISGAIILTWSGVAHRHKFYPAFAHGIYGIVMLMVCAVFVLGSTVEDWIDIGLSIAAI
jgi:hypothetical protein